MSLNFNFSKVSNNETVVTDAIWQTFPYAMMAAGFGKVTEKNWREVFFRISVFEKLFGAYRREVVNEKTTKPKYYTILEVKSLIGFTCNVKDESEASWRKRLLDSFKSDVLWSAKEI